MTKTAIANPKNVSHTGWVIGTKDDDEGEWEFIRPWSYNHPDNRGEFEKESESLEFSTNIEIAGIIPINRPELLLGLMERMFMEYECAAVRAFELDLKVTFKTVDMFDEQILNLRRHRALEKLSQDDIEALNITELAVYDKLAFHKVDDDGLF